jgi:proteasome accessory factor C
MSATDDVARMLTLVPWLLERPGASFSEIASSFGVDEQTIARDLGALDFCGLPGLGGGDLFDVSTVGDRVVVSMADELKRPLRPTPREALRLVLTVDAMAEVAGDEVPALRSALVKIRSALGISERAADVVDASGHGLLTTLRTAIRADRQLELTYQGRNDTEPQHRTIDPWALDVVDGTFYLQGHDHGVGERRVFRVDRIVAVTPTERTIEQPRPADLPTPRYVPGPDHQPVELEVTPTGRWLIDAVVVDEVLDQPDGSTRLRLRTDAPSFVARLVLMAGGQARVVEPASLAAEVRALAGAARTRYQSAPPERVPGD